MFVFYNYLQIKLSIDRNLCTMNGTMKTYSCLYHDNVLAIWPFYIGAEVLCGLWSGVPELDGKWKSWTLAGRQI